MSCPPDPSASPLPHRRLKRVLVTGAGGFVARHLVAALEQSCEVFGAGLEAGSEGRNFPLDVSDREAVRRIVADLRPDTIFHLAGLAFVPDSWLTPEKYLLINTAGVLNVLEAMRTSVPEARMVLASSGEVYGYSLESGEPATEEMPCLPASPYAASKLAADLMAFACFRQYGTDVVRLRLFNHTGPGQRADFAFPAFARQVALAEAGRQPPVLRTGNLEVDRSFADVRDIVAAYELAATRGRRGACYVLGSPEVHRLKDLAELLLSMARVPMRLELDEQLVRRADTRRIACDPSKFMAETGWRPEIPIRQTLRDLLEDWRGRVTDTREES